MTTTPIRNLTLMMDINTRRMEAIEAAEKRDDISSLDAGPANRVWCRQHEALSCAIIVEPPQTFDDVLSVLTELAARHDLLIGQGDEMTKRERRDLDEMTAVAVKNCTRALARMFRPDEEPTETQQQSLKWVSRQVGQWLPAEEGC